MADFIETHVATYLASLAPPITDPFASHRARCVRDGVPAMADVTLDLLGLLAAILPARKTLEVGTGYGLSGATILLAAGPDSQLFTMERDPARAAVARGHFADAGVGTRVNVMVGEAARLVHKVAGPFDLIVQDGEITVYGPMLDRLVALLRPGGVLVSDNVLWAGDVVPGFADHPVHSAESTEVIADYNRRLAVHPQLRTTFLPVGDGVAVSLRRERSS